MEALLTVPDRQRAGLACGVPGRRTVFAKQLLIAAAVGGLVSACGNTTAPSPLLGISCPAAQTAQTTTGGPVAVVYPPPTVSGGSSPVTSVCTPPSGSSFSPGTINVACTARDAAQQTATCGFTVTVSQPPKLTATRFVAFGDSITAGTLDPPCTTISPFSLGSRVTEQRILEQAINVPTSYPTKLQGLLAARYVSQSPIVLNEGKAGEGVGPTDGGSRLPIVLAADSPQVLLLEEGINDIDPSNPATFTFVANGLRSMIQTARASGVQPVFVATLLPERAGACRGGRAGVIVPANDQIRAMVNGEGVVLVDLYAAFGGEASTALIGFDGLHPTEAGYQLIAQTFFDTIRQRLEAAGTTAARFR